MLAGFQWELQELNSPWPHGLGGLWRDAYSNQCLTLAGISVELPGEGELPQPCL